MFFDLQEVTFLDASRPTSVMTNLTDPTKEQLANLASKMDQMLESQDKIREDFQAELKNVNSNIETIKQSQKKDRAKYDTDLRKADKEKTELTERFDQKYDALQKHYARLKEQLREKNERVNNLIKENVALKNQLNQKDKKQRHTQNSQTIRQLQDEMKILKDEKQTLEKENTILKRDTSFYLKPYPRASLPRIVSSTTGINTTYQDLYRKNIGKKS